VLALMVVAVWLLGVGTLKDLALVQLVGILVGTYSSIFFATPLLVSLRERTEQVRTHTRRVVKRRRPGADAEEQPEPSTKSDASEESDAEAATESSQDTAKPAEHTGTKAPEAPGKPAPNKPAPGARPVRPTGTRRPSGKRNAGRR
jgi:preprotein translocase subunit SecF